jgi:hypothetical protein
MNNSTPLNTPLASYTQSIERPQQHEFYILNSGLTDVDHDMPISALFPVKEIIVSAGYCADDEVKVGTPVLYYITSTCPAFTNNQVITSLNANPVFNSTLDKYSYCSALGENKMRFILRQPMMLAGNWSYRINAIRANAATVDLVLNLELLG